MTIKVTQEHIEKGKRADLYECPLALAINRATGRQAIVRCSDMWVGLHYMELPKELAEFVFRFDLGMPVAPFEFDLPL